MMVSFLFILLKRPMMVALGLFRHLIFDCDQLTWTTDGANAGTIFLRGGKHNCTNVCGTLQPIKSTVLLKFFSYSLQYVAQFYKRPDTNGAKIMNGEMADSCFISVRY
jgi:type I restriction enzyme S subunit